MLLVNKEEGFKALFKGSAPKVLRLGPGGKDVIYYDDCQWRDLKKF